jgi:hypothetical protein
MAELQRLLSSAGIDPEAAPKLLAIAASYLRRGEALPPEIASYLATAFEKAAKQPRGEQVNALKDGLGLGVVTGSPRKSIDKGDVALTVVLHGEQERELGLRLALAKTYGVSKNTAKARITETREKLAVARKHVGNIRMRKRGDEK